MEAAQLFGRNRHLAELWVEPSAGDAQVFQNCARTDGIEVTTSPSIGIAVEPASDG